MRVRFDTLDKLVNELAVLHERGCAFRGERRCFPTVKPTLYRSIMTAPDELFEWEDNLLDQFLEVASHDMPDDVRGLLTANRDRRRRQFAFISVASILQHFGVPTRLIDWTMSPWIAAFFAVEDYDDNDGRILWFSRLHLQEANSESYWHVRDGIRHPLTGQIELNRLIRRAEPKEFITQIEPHNWSFDRLTRQQGLHTIAGVLGTDHFSALHELIPGHVGIIEINASQKQAMRAITRSMGLCAGGLGLWRAEHHARSVQDKWRDYCIDRGWTNSTSKASG